MTWGHVLAFVLGCLFGALVITFGLASLVRAAQDAREQHPDPAGGSGGAVDGGGGSGGRPEVPSIVDPL